MSGAAQPKATFQTFEVARRANQTILDVVTAIERDQDAPTLPFCPPGRHVRLLRDGGYGPAGWTCRTRVRIWSRTAAGCRSSRSVT